MPLRPYQTCYPCSQPDSALTSHPSPSLQVSHEFRHRVTPSHASAIKQEVRVELYSSDQTQPTYVDDRMTLVETIVLPLDMTRVAHEDAYHIDLSFKFGSAEIEVGAWWLAGWLAGWLVLAGCWLDAAGGAGGVWCLSEVLLVAVLLGVPGLTSVLCSPPA
jgi:hypothetical protein